MRSESPAIKCRSSTIVLMTDGPPVKTKLVCGLWREKALVEIALYQPDIPQNTATILRLGACLGIPVHIIEPAGFHWSDKSLRRAGMDYLEHVRIVRHVSWRHFCELIQGQRLVLATTKGAVQYTDFEFAIGDIVVFGRESAGVPHDVFEFVDTRITIQMEQSMRSLNVAMSCAMIAGEAMRQLRSTA